jgi:hypothetical protein
LSSADYDLSAINVAAKARTAIVINITALAGMPVRNSLISFLRCSSQRQKNLHNREKLQRVQKMMRNPRLRVFKMSQQEISEMALLRKKHRDLSKIEAGKLELNVEAVDLARLTPHR